VAGHRDSSGSLNACSGTVCPGDSFYPMLPEIVVQIADLPCYAEPVSSNDLIENIQVSVYPNPVKDHVFIKSNDQDLQTFELININGVSFGFLPQGEFTDVSHLESGMYFLMLNGELVQKIIKN